jgi:serine/threonine protein phosphatase PrpC
MPVVSASVKRTYFMNASGQSMPAPGDTAEVKPGSPFIVRSFGISDRGQKRDSNEDCFAIAELARTLQVHHTNLPQSPTSLSFHRAYVFLIADGVGGSNAGEVASGLSVTTIEDFLLNTLKRFSNLQASEEQGALRALQDALCEADSRIFEETAKHPEWRGMGTTLTMAFAVNWRLFVAHAGDSRCYLYSRERLQQLTQDHTMIAEMARRGVISADEAVGHPLRHVVTNILGGKEPGVQVELHSLDLHADDVLLLCSDGLTEMVSEEQIAAVLQEENDPQRACERLITEANRLGGKDNVTVIVTRISATGSAPEPPPHQ